MNNNNINEIDIQKNIAYTAGLLQGDITIKRLLESIAEGVVIINEIGRIILINSRFAEMIGYSKMEIMGKDLNVLINPDRHEVHENHLKSFFENPRIRPMGIGLELSVHRKDNTIFPVEISVSFLETETGQLGIGFITDNTLRKKSLDQLTRRNLELDAYAHTVAHDLKSSLSGITGFSELLLDKEQNFDHTQRNEIIETISNASKKMDSVIRELLLFASIDKVNIELNKFTMKEVVEAACTRLKYQIDRNKATITLDENIIDCRSYSSWVEEAWLNYISNAVKYGGEKPHIIIKSERVNNGFVKYSVKDNGPGIEDGLKDIIFEESSSKKDATTKGTGLGLTIVKRIIEKLDGYVSVESNLNEGCEFSFYLKE